MEICCFTGHRTIASADEEILTARLYDAILRLTESGFTEYRAGGALGFDTMAALAVLEVRRTHPEVRLHLILPCRDQTRGWTGAQVTLYEKILAQADRVTYISDAYYDGVMLDRNRALVDGSSLCIAYKKRERGGTAYTCRYAEKRGVRVLNLADGLTK